MSLARVHNFTISLDGFGTGEGLSRDAPFGHAGRAAAPVDVHHAVLAVRLGQPGGTGGIDDAFAQQFEPGIGAEIMGAGKFGPPGWHEDPEWKGAWGPNPPFHTPTFVLTHHPRPPIEMEGGTTFHFLDTSPAEALETARKAADDQDVRIGGGPTVSATSSPPDSSTNCTSWWSRCCSAGACASGTAWRASRRTTRSRPRPRPPGSRM